MYSYIYIYTKLVGGLEHFVFFHILGIIVPTDELIFFRGVGIPPTKYKYIHIMCLFGSKFKTQFFLVIPTNSRPRRL